MAATLAALEQQIETWIQQSKPPFDRAYVEAKSGRCWVLKFFSPQYLAQFMARPELVISTTPGFTWGDGVYVVPLDHVYSAMIYGRVGVMGWIGVAERRRVYDASEGQGLELYQEWIQYKPGLFRLLTTTVHSQEANRRLRNAFRKRFTIDLTLFRPDEFNAAYVRPRRDRWCVVSDFNASVGLPAGTVGFSWKVRECELVVLGGEEFALDRNGFVRRDLIGPQLLGSGAVRGTVASAVPLSAQLSKTYQDNRARGTNPPTFLALMP